MIVENCQILVFSAKWALFSNPLTYTGQQQSKDRNAQKTPTENTMHKRSNRRCPPKYANIN